MKKYLLLLLMLCSCDNKQASTNNECPLISVKFSPLGGAEGTIVAGIDDAKKSVHVLSYSFTAINIAEALVRAKNRGSEVIVVSDRETTGNPNSVIKYLKENNVDIYIDAKHAISHNKVIIIDKEIVFTGSFNFSKGAEEKNAENSLKIIDAKTANIYYDNFELHKEHSKVYLL